MKLKIWGISGLVTVVMLVSLASPVTPAAADALSWSAETIPNTTDYILGPDGIDICDIAVAADSSTVYAVMGDSITDDVLYKSTDAGASWTTLDIPIEADLVAIAPDDADIIAIADNSTPEVYLTVNGGSIWHDFGTPQESGAAAAVAIYDIAISKASDDVHYIAVAGKEAGDVANVWYYQAGAVGATWQETNTLTGFSSGDEVAAVAFSPNFPSDKVMLAVSEDDNSSVKLQMLSLSSNRWNSSANFGSYPVTVVSDDGITGLASASISLAPNYLASQSSRRTAFVSVAVSGDAAATAKSGIYRFKDTTRTSLTTGTTIHSVAFNGSCLVAGAYGTTNVYRSGDPLATSPTISTVSTMKGPGGEGKTLVAWAGSKVVAVTSGDESAFAVSTNNGKTFNDISLIDTSITNARDVAVSADGSKFYLVTDDGTDLSLWRKVSVWERTLSLQGTTDYIVRAAPNNANVIYLAKKGDTTIYYNASGGAKEWLTRSCSVNVRDLAVESTEIVYALNSSGSVSQTTDAGFTWGTARTTELNSGATIVSVSSNKLLVGSQDGYVAYSTDGNSSWTKISVVLQSGAGNVQVIADENFATNKIIYAASDAAGQDIKKWQIDTSSEWTDIFHGNVAGGIYGLAIRNGTFYALEFNASTGQSTLWRHFTPTTVTDASTNWSTSTTSADTDDDDAEVHLNAIPRALKVSSDRLWAVKTNGTSKLYSFTDIPVEIKLAKPASGFTNPVNAISGLANDIAFRWKRPSEATEYELEIALDSDFFIIVTTVTIATDEPVVFVIVGPYQTGDARVNFMAGKTYYWRVQTTQPLYSLYSDTNIFNIEPLVAMVPGLLVPANGSTDISRKPSFSWEPVAGASEYQFMLSANSTMTSPLIDTKVMNTGFTITEDLDYGAIYLWKVRATKPVESDWSTLANFTVEEKPAESVLPPLIIQQVPPPVITVPQPPPSNIVTFSPPPVTPPPTVPDYLRAVIVIAAILLLAVIALIIKPFTVRPSRRVAEGLSGGWGKLREGMATYFRDFNPLRTFRGAKARFTGVAGAEASQPISFAAKSFLWMMSQEKEESPRLLSAEEEQALGRILASRIQKIARDQLLYQEFPEDAALFLDIWSHYGSRDETDRYLANSFRSRPENVIKLLKCYLTTPGGLEAGLTRKTYFSRTRYYALVKVIDPDKVYEALTRLYGPELESPEDETPVDSTDKAIAFQFARIHHRVMSEIETADKTAGQKEAGMVRADTR